MIVTLAAGQLAYDHVGSRVSWTIADPEALLEQSTPFGTLDWVSHSEGLTVLGVTFIEPADRTAAGYRATLLDGQRVVVTSDDYWLDPRTTITADLEDVDHANGGSDPSSRSPGRDSTARTVANGATVESAPRGRSRDMAAEQAMWHVNDVVAYDAMRELSASVQAHLLDREREGDGTARAELLEIRRLTLAVDGYDRTAVDEFSQRLQRRDVELTRVADGH